MHRSASTSRASDEFHLVSISPQTKGSPGLLKPPGGIDHLPTFNPLSEVSKKEASRTRSSENAVHFIPLVLILCAIVLWSFSHPVVVANKNGSDVSLLKELKIAGFNNQLSFSTPKSTKKMDKRKWIAGDKSVGPIQNNIFFVAS